MMAATHMETGAVAWTGIVLTGTIAWQAGLIPGEQLALAAAVGYPLTIFAALWPDIDHPGSRIARMLLGPFGPLRTLIVRLIAGPLNGHRGGTHTVWAALTVGALGALIAPWVGLAVATGVLAHIYGDCHTKHGVAVAWPVSDHVVRLGKVRTGSALGEGWWRLKQAGVGGVLLVMLALTATGWSPEQVVAL